MIPRLAVFRSSKYLYVQLIDDEAGKTMLGMSDKKLAREKKFTKSEKALELGEEFAKEALKMKIEKVVFDRGGNIFLGRVKSFAEGARKGGLKF